MILLKEITSALQKCESADVRQEYETRLAEGDLVRDINPHSHFCTYFVPYNKVNKTILVGDHKKSGLWLMPGGHTARSR